MRVAEQQWSAPRGTLADWEHRSDVAAAPGDVQWEWSATSHAAKRIFDVAFASAVLLIGSPLYLLIALLVAVTSRGPIFYASPRIGRFGQEFGCWKFRTMVPDAAERLAVLLESCPDSRREFAETFKLRNDPRITPIGRFLRNTSLDELPQFVNVLKGDMSVVGPRPPLPVERETYGEHLLSVLSIRPGITGPWQVSGRNNLAFESRIRHAYDYIANRSMRTDLAVIARTAVVVLRPSRSNTA